MSFQKKIKNFFRKIGIRIGIKFFFIRIENFKIFYKSRNLKKSKIEKPGWVQDGPRMGPGWVQDGTRMRPTPECPGIRDGPDSEVFDPKWIRGDLDSGVFDLEPRLTVFI